MGRVLGWYFMNVIGFFLIWFTVAAIVGLEATGGLIYVFLQSILWPIAVILWILIASFYDWPLVTMIFVGTQFLVIIIITKFDIYRHKLDRLD